MTTDNETIETSYTTKDFDFDCWVTEQKELENIVNAWHELLTARSIYSYCENIINSKSNSWLSITNCQDVDDLPKVEIVKYLKRPIFGSEPFSKKVFDLLVEDVEKLINVVSAKSRIDEDLKKFKEEQASAMQSEQKYGVYASIVNSLQNQIKSCQSSLEYSQDISRLFEFLPGLVILAVAFIIGGIAGFWGSVIAVIAVLIWGITYNEGLIFMGIGSLFRSLRNTQNSKEELIELTQELEIASSKYTQEIEKLKKLQVEEYKAKRIDLENELSKIQDNLAIKVALVFAFVELFKIRVDRFLTQQFLDVLVRSAQFIQIMYFLLDRILAFDDNGGMNNSKIPSWQMTRDWQDKRWLGEYVCNNYSPRMEGIAPLLIRVGTLSRLCTPKSSYSVDLKQCRDTAEEVFVKEEIDIRVDELPLLMQCRSSSQAKKSGHIVIFSNSPETRQAATAALESIALRAIATFPVRTLQGTFIDPVSMSGTFPFKNSLPEEIRGKRIYTTSDDIQEELRKLSTHIEEINQKLGRDFANIEEYNAEARVIQEAYRYLFIADFPKKFDTRSFEYLNSLLDNGAKCGVYIIVHIDETLEQPRNFNYDLFESHCQILRPAEKNYNDAPLFVYKSPEAPIICYATLDKPPESDRFNQLTAMISQASGEVKDEGVPFSRYIYPDILWTEDSRKEIRTAIGILGAQEKLEFWLGENSQGFSVYQSLLFGKPGAGKSYTLHSIINGLAMRYAPDELELYLLDFKEGVEFQVYVNSDRGEDANSPDSLDFSGALPHAKVISIESDREFGLSVLRKINEQFEIRANEWKSISNDITKVAEYRDRTNGKKMPRILIIIDEFQVLFEENDDISSEINQILETIVRKGRAYGIHLLLASQSPNIKNMSQNIYKNIDVRMAMQMSQDVADMVLAAGNTDVINLLKKPGEIIYNTDFGRKDGNDPRGKGRVADASSGERKKALRKIQETVQATGYQRPPTDQLVVFDGRHPTRLRNNGLLTVLASADTWLSPADIKDIVNESNWRVRDFPSIAWVGEAMQIGYHSRAIFRRRSRSNMLLVGNIEENIFGILGGVMTSLVCSHQPQKAEFHIIDLSDEDDRGSHWSSMTLNFREAFSPYFPITIAKDFADSDRQISKANTTLQNIHAEFERRKQLRESDPDTTNFGASIFFVAAIGTLERLNSLRPTVDNRGNPDMSDDAKKLMAIASQGAELGIHLILWVEGIKTLNQLFAGKERISLSNFDLRIGLTMPTDDSRALFNETLAANLTKLRAYFKDEATAANLEKFKPYAVPTQQEFADYANYLNRKV